VVVTRRCGTVPQFGAESVGGCGGIVDGVWCSIIIPTLYEEPIVNASLPPVSELVNRGIEVIVVWDR
jgi:hypothetical protein